MRYVMAVLLLAGVLYGQDACSGITSRNECYAQANLTHDVYCLGNEVCKPLRAKAISDGTIILPNGQIVCGKESGCEVPPPMDVPAVKPSNKWDMEQYPCKFHTTINGIEQEVHDDEPYCVPKSATCADKRRVLLTSEDGNKHCILFPSQGK